jgi:putative IMPACT (imprinted ancient) family translation regulator
MTPSQRYPIPAARFRSEIEVERSRFIATVQPVTSSAEAQAFIASIKTEFPDANHNCWAYLVGPPGSTDQAGLSDDGEPHGVAGKPIMIVLQYSGLGDTAVVERMSWVKFIATFDYALVTAFERRLKEFEADVLDMEYGERVCCRLRVPEEHLEDFSKMFNDLSGGQGQLKSFDWSNVSL